MYWKFKSNHRIYPTEPTQRFIPYSLWELSYIWNICLGGSSSKILFPLFKTQKKAMRVIFGDRDKYNDKFKTCCRTRHYKEQKLSQEFFIEEPSKPIFNSHGFVNLQNLNFYHSCCEIFKIFKYKSPVAILNLFKFSSRCHKNLYGHVYKYLVLQIAQFLPSVTFCIKTQ